MFIASNMLASDRSRPSRAVAPAHATAAGCLLLLWAALALASPGVDTPTFAGRFVRGTGDTRFLRLLDLARRQYASEEYEYQSVGSLYRGDWDGLTEGPRWAAYWTQNSYGPTLGGLPIMDPVTWHATQHSMAWWFDSIGNSTKVDGAFGTTRTAHGDVPAPDGALCDAARPCGPAKDCCAYKQGDGNVPMHDWTFEETLSAVVMVGEQILVGRNASAAADYLPLFLRTSNMLEARRDPATSYSTFLTGPSSNLLAPSFGGASVGQGYGGWAALTGVQVTYIAALDRMTECARLVGDGSLVQLFQRRRALTADGLALLTAPGPTPYFARSRDPNGTLHGVLGQAKHGYFEASPNHDAVALRVVNDTQAEAIMALIDGLGTRIRPNVFMLPNTDAGGGVGYDDMLCGTGKTCGGIFTYGTWVNGGVWTTTEARAILAYYRTGRQALAADSMENMVNKFAADWRMDAPLPNFGTAVWFAEDPINLTIDAFGVAAAFLRGLFESVYTASALFIVPHLPANITSLELKFPIRWGAYRLYVSTSGLPTSGIASATLNGTAIVAPLGTVNATTIALHYLDMPLASPAAAASVTSDISTAADSLGLHITFRQAAPKNKAPTTTTPKTAAPAAKPALWLDATSLSATLRPGDNVTVWPNMATAASPLSNATGDCAGVGGSTPVFTGTAVHFDGTSSRLCGSLALAPTKTVFAVFKATGPAGGIYSAVFHDDSERGLTVTPSGCSKGYPAGPAPCNASSPQYLCIDWSGSENIGVTDVTQRLVAAEVAYGPGTASSWVSGCPQQQPSESVRPVAAGASANFIVGMRGGYERYFNGDVAEILVYNRTLSPADESATRAYLMDKYSIEAKVNCTKPLPTVNCTSFQATYGPNASLVMAAASFVDSASAGGLKETVPVEMAQAASQYLAGFRQRCREINNGTLVALPSAAARVAALKLLLGTAGQLLVGVNNTLHNYRLSYRNSTLAQELAALWHL